MTFKNHIVNLTDSFRNTFSLNEIRNVILTLYFLKYQREQYSFNLHDSIVSFFDKYQNFSQEKVSSPLDNLKASLFTGDFSSLLKKIETETSTLYKVFQDLGIDNISRNRDNAMLNLFKEFIGFDFSKIEDYRRGFDELITLFSEKESRLQQTSFDTPSSIREIYKVFLGRVETVFDPTCGTGSLLDSFLDSDTVKLYGNDTNSESLAVAKLRFAFDSNVELKERNSLFGDESIEIKTDAVVMTPPFNLRFSKDNISYANYWPYGIPSQNNANMLWLQVAINHMNNEGKAILLLANSSLSTFGREGEIRKAIVEDGLIEAIISLPAGLLPHTRLSSTIWVLSKERRSENEILMIDISDMGVALSRVQNEIPTEVIKQIKLCYKSWSDESKVMALPPYQARVTKIEEIAKNDFILAPGRYLPVNGLDEYDLSQAVELTDIITRQIPIASADEMPFNIKKLSIKDLATSIDQFEIDVNALEIAEENRNNRVFGGNLLLIAENGDRLKPSFLPDIKNNLGYALMNIYPFQVDTKRVRIDYLIQELNKEYVQLQVSRFRSGSAIPFIRAADFLNVKIFLPSLEVQGLAVKKEKEVRFQSLAKLHGFEDEIKRLKEQHRKDLGSKKHNIMQHLNNVKSSSNVLMKFLHQNGGVLTSDQIINQKAGITVLKRFQRLNESIDNVLFYVDNLTNEIEFQKPEILNAHALIKECVEKGIQPVNAFLVDISDLETFEMEPLITVSKIDFEEVYNNIIQNAVLHGFTDSVKKYEFRYSILIIDNKVEVTFENNGKPFPKGMGKKEAYCTRGEKAGINANTGEGSWKVCQIAQHFGADLTIIDEPNEDFPVGIKLTFNLVQ
jgi:type I restriction-modification system DNA methylase subunit